MNVITCSSTDMQVASLAEARRLRVDNEGADEEDAEVDGVGEDDLPSYTTIFCVTDTVFCLYDP